MKDLFIATSEGNTMVYKITSDGNDCDGYGIQLIKYIGPELPKELRRFEFDAYICEYPETKDKFLSRNYPIENEFGYRATEIIDSREYAEKRLSGINVKNGIISKWKFTMEELCDSE